MNVQQAQKIYYDIRQNKMNFKTHWEELSQYISPTRGKFYDRPLNERKEIDYKKLINNTVGIAVDTLSAGMLNGLTSPSREWFKLTTSMNDNIAVAQWTNLIKKRMEYIFQKSNFYNTLHNVYQELAVFGTACFIVEEDFDNVIHCTQFTANEYALQYNTKGLPVMFGREFFMTAQQMVEDFGYENVGANVRTQYDNRNYSAPFKVYHLICENKNRDKSKVDNKNYRYKSVYWQCDEQNFLRESGYNYFPVIAPRYAVNSSQDTYGYGIGDKVLGDCRMLQKLEKVKLIGLQKVVEPPLLVSSQVQGKVNVTPNGLTRFSGTTDSAVYPMYKVQLDLPSLSAEIANVEKRITNNFYYDVFLMLTSQEYARMTATEVAERHQEKLMMLGPVLQRLNSELLDPMIEKTFYLMVEAGLVPPAPEVIQEAEVRVEYVSIIAQAQKAQGMAEINQGTAFVGQVAQAYPEVLDVINPDRLIYVAFDKIGVDPDVIRTPEEIEVIREQRAMQQAQQQQIADENVQADTMEKLSKAKTGDASALTELMGGPAV